MARPIGVMDSGSGGLTVLKALLRRFPQENFIYVGDTARVPYGIHTAPVVTRYTKEIIDFLISRKVKLIVLACNTASAAALPRLKKHYPVPLLGVVAAGAKAAAGGSAGPKLKIGVIGTKATIASKVYEKLIKALNPGAQVHAIACPLFVPLVEENWIRHDIAKTVARHYLAPLIRKKPQALILGCTHYPLLKNVISRIMGKNVAIIDSPTAVAQELSQMLNHNKPASKPASSKRRVIFFVTDDPQGFKKKARLFLGGPLPGPVKLVRLR